jgi:enoyl-CoA hydratase/3-hydroxyacyl-CoA dehydrogenase
MGEAEARDVIHNLYGTMDYADIADADWVIEAATENLPLKRKIFAQIEAVVRPDALITSNTSSLPAELIFRNEASRARHRDPLLRTGLAQPGVEVIEWKKSDPAVVEYLRWAFCMTGKVPLLTADVACFMLDRIFDNWCNESALLLDRATAAEIDSVAAEFVHAGPFFVLNLAHGNPIITETNTLQAEMEARTTIPRPSSNRSTPGSRCRPARRSRSPRPPRGDPRPPARHPLLAKRGHRRPQDRRLGRPRPRLPPGAGLQARPAGLMRSLGDRPPARR